MVNFETLGKFAETEFKSLDNKSYYLMLMSDTSIKTKNFLIGQDLDDGLHYSEIFTDILEAMKCYCDCLKDISNNELFIIGNSEFTDTEAIEFINFKREIKMITKENKKKVKERNDNEFSLNKLFQD